MKDIVNKEVARFPGMFQWWSYAVGHGQLLLRRTKNEMFAKRIDILFTNVDAIQLATILHDPAILLDDLSAVPKTALSGVDLGERKLYRILAGEFEGYVVAGNCVWHEDEGEYDEPSALV